MKQQKNIILTGGLHGGKSTLVREVLSRLECEIRGLVCEALEQDGIRLGYGWRKIGRPDVDIFAHIDFDENRFGEYGFRNEPFERAAEYLIACLTETPQIVVIDEIGFFEQHVESYQDGLRHLLDSPVSVLLVVQQRAVYFWEKVKGRRDVIVLTLGENNHIELQKELHRLLEEITNPDCGID